PTLRATLTLHDALPIYAARAGDRALRCAPARRPRRLRSRRLRRVPFADGAHARLRDGALRRLLGGRRVRLRPAVPVGLEAHGTRSEEHTSELQSRENLV